MAALYRELQHRNLSHHDWCLDHNAIMQPRLLPAAEAITSNTICNADTAPCRREKQRLTRIGQAL